MLTTCPTVQGRCTVGSIRGANRGPHAPLAAIIPLLHRAPHVCMIPRLRFTPSARNKFGLYLYRPTRIHTTHMYVLCMHSTYIYRDIHTFMHTYMHAYIHTYKQPPRHYPINYGQWENAISSNR